MVYLVFFFIICLWEILKLEDFIVLGGWNSEFGFLKILFLSFNLVRCGGGFFIDVDFRIFVVIFIGWNNKK